MASTESKTSSITSRPFALAAGVAVPHQELGTRFPIPTHTSQFSHHPLYRRWWLSYRTSIFVGFNVSQIHRNLPATASNALQNIQSRVQSSAHQQKELDIISILMIAQAKVLELLDEEVHIDVKQHQREDRSLYHTAFLCMFQR